jgi:BirA family biotin operon repressor/biotin-[acetyl-CoA-carboxylase] ligase
MTARLAAWEAGGFGPVRQAWLESAAGIGKPCTARTGRDAVEGVAEGLDVDGALLLRLEDGQLRRISAGEVVFGSL